MTSGTETCDFTQLKRLVLSATLRQAWVWKLPSFCLVTKLRHRSWHLPWACHDVSADPCSLLPLSISWHWSPLIIPQCNFLLSCYYPSLHLLVLLISKAWWELWFIPLSLPSIFDFDLTFYKILILIFSSVFSLFQNFNTFLLYLWCSVSSFYHSLYYTQTFLFCLFSCLEFISFHYLNNPFASIFLSIFISRNCIVF